MKKQRGFEPVNDAHVHYKQKVVVHGKEKLFAPEIQLPVRADARSAGYDFFAPTDITLLPAQKTLIWTNVKAYMGDGEVLMLFPRSSLGIKQGVMLGNTVGVIDASYYSNPDNDGNIGISLLNTSGKAIKLKRGERIVQGVFIPYLTADADETLSDSRSGGIGSSGK